MTNGFAGCSKISAGRADLLDAALVHDDDPVGDLEGLLLVVRDEDAGDVDLVVQPAQPLAQLLAHLGVERAERLVEQQHLRLGGERARQRDALALAAGELRRQRALEPSSCTSRSSSCTRSRISRLRALAHAQAEGDVLEHRHVPEQRVVLEDEADVALADGRVGDVLVLVEDRAAVRRPPARR